MRNMVFSTLFEEDFINIENKLEELGVNIIEERYDLLYHRYEIYVKVNLRQRYKLRRFSKNCAVNILELEA